MNKHAIVVWPLLLLALGSRGIGQSPPLPLEIQKEWRRVSDAAPAIRAEIDINIFMPKEWMFIDPSEKGGMIVVPPEDEDRTYLLRMWLGTGRNTRIESSGLHYFQAIEDSIAATKYEVTGSYGDFTCLMPTSEEKGKVLSRGIRMKKTDETLLLAPIYLPFSIAYRGCDECLLKYFDFKGLRFDSALIVDGKKEFQYSSINPQSRLVARVASSPPYNLTNLQVFHAASDKSGWLPSAQYELTYGEALVGGIPKLTSYKGTNFRHSRPSQSTFAATVRILELDPAANSKYHYQIDFPSFCRVSDPDGSYIVTKYGTRAAVGSTEQENLKIAEGSW